jgi:Na+/proline symporter
VHAIDWTILLAVLIFIVTYGVYKTRHINTAEEFLAGDRQTPWWMVGLSIMATQASAITFLSTPGQAYIDGMGFVQFYIGLPIAMVLLAVFVLPKYFELKVYTAYEFLEGRFGVSTRTLTAVLFLIQRGLAAGITIFAPAIILSTLLGWNLMITNVVIGSLVIIYTLAGGTDAVSQTQKQQMFVIMSGMVIAFITIVKAFPSDVSFSDALHLSGQMGKLEVLNFEFDLSDRYNVWSGILGGTFLFLSYFGTDQSQVQRYLSGKSLKESRMGLMFNGLFKVPMQFFILLTGVMVFVFFQFHQSPMHFNPASQTAMEQSAYSEEFASHQQDYDAVFEEKSEAITHWLSARESGDEAGVTASMNTIREMETQELEIRSSVKELLPLVDEGLETNDKDYVFLHFVLNYLPVGLVGLLLAVIFSAAMSSTASELNALATTTVVDIYKRSFAASDMSDKKYLNASRWFTLLWGILAIIFAISASLFENLIQAVNILGSLFYGTILGIFVVALFTKKVGGRTVFWSAIFVELCIITIFILDHHDIIHIAYLWLNAIGCLGVLFISLFIDAITPKANRAAE